MHTTQTMRIGTFRWVICGLLFLAATITYIDRQVIGILKSTLQAQFGWSEIDYSDIVFAFQLAYAIGFIFAGRLMDRVGTKIGFSLALTIWSLAAVAHAGATSFGPAAERWSEIKGRVAIFALCSPNEIVNTHVGHGKRDFCGCFSGPAAASGRGLWGAG